MVRLAGSRWNSKFGPHDLVTRSAATGSLRARPRWRHLVFDFRPKLANMAAARRSVEVSACGDFASGQFASYLGLGCLCSRYRCSIVPMAIHNKFYDGTE